MKQIDLNELERHASRQRQIAREEEERELELKRKEARIEELTRRLEEEKRKVKSNPWRLNESKPYQPKFSTNL